MKDKKSNSLNKKIVFGSFAAFLIALGLGLGLTFGLKKPVAKKVIDETTKTELTEAQTALAEAEEAAQAAEASQIKLKKGLQELNNILRSETLKNQKQKKALQDTFKQQLEKTVTKAEEAAAAEQHELKTDVDVLTKALTEAEAALKTAKTKAQQELDQIKNILIKAAVVLNQEAIGQQRIKDLQKTIKELKNKDKKIQELEAFLLEIKNLAKDLEEAKKELKELQKKDETIKDLTAEKKQLKNEIAWLSEVWEATKNNLKTAQQELFNALKTERLKLKALVAVAAKAEAEAANKAQAATQAEATVKTASILLSGIKQILDETKQTNKNLKTELATTKAENKATAAEIATSKNYLTTLQKLAINKADKDWIIEKLNDKTSKNNYIKGKPDLNKPDTTEKEKTDAYTQYLLWQFIKRKLGNTAFNALGTKYKNYFFNIIHPAIKTEAEKINLEAKLKKATERAERAEAAAEQAQDLVAEAAEAQQDLEAVKQEITELKAELNELKGTDTD